ncbi:hypothetical protein SAMN05216207_10114 [Pseudonocardia ammonioxydans]|uniref:TPR-repeat-containing protein n=1 Tax=Pseudonocardia ammonioxydans TaxID=260086 RepID=A0A1I4XDZ7_PSUAM|nr:hypothetical protein SAMN05216207_10114 [Pseudonocardia ammonioxydans]
MRPRRDQRPADDSGGSDEPGEAVGVDPAGAQPADTAAVGPAVGEQPTGPAAEANGRSGGDDRAEQRPRRRPEQWEDRRARGPRTDRRRDDRPGRGDDRRERGGRPRRVPEAAERTMVVEPELPDSISASELDASVRRDLRGLQKETAESVARHLVAAGVLVDEEPELALEHVRYARRRASRIAVVREAAGIVAYHAGEWNEALGEFRASRRMGGGPGHVHVMADIERALGRPERALDLARSPEARDLGTEERIELLIVAAGARRDLGEVEAAVVGLQVPELEASRRDPWSARLFYAFADNLLAAGRESEAVEWFVHAHDADTDGRTDAAHRIAELTGEELPGLEEDELSVAFEDVPVDELHGEIHNGDEVHGDGEVHGGVSHGGESDGAGDTIGSDRDDADDADDGVPATSTEAAVVDGPTALEESGDDTGEDRDGSTDGTGPAEADVPGDDPGPEDPTAERG